MAPEVALAALSLLHAGFQSVVSVVVYPALAATPDRAWAAVHTAHSRRMARLVGPLYLALLIANLLVLVEGPWTVGTLAALVGNGTAALTTALIAGPTHHRLASGRAPELMSRLLGADRVRLAGAVLAGAGGLAVLSAA